MPLIVAAVASYAAGLLVGFASVGDVGRAAALPWLAGALLLIGLLLRRLQPAALLAMLLAGVVAARAAAASERRCRHHVGRTAAWRVLLEDAASPGVLARGVLMASGCRLAVALAVERGFASAGSVAYVAGRVVPSRRGVLVQRASVVATRERSLLRAMRADIGRRLDATFHEDAPLARALLIADARSLDPALRDRFADAGLVHMLSISGLHVAIIAAAVQLVLRALRLSPDAAMLATVGTTALYIALIGAPAPALRSGVMLGVAAASRLRRRPTSPWAALAIGAAVPLVEARTVLDVGYQLSVAGMAALIASGALARRWIAPRLDGLGADAASLMLASTMALVVTAPLIAWRFGRLSLISPLSNMVATPLIALAQPALFVALLCLPVPEVAEFIADATHPLLAALERLAAAAAALPHATLSVAPTLSGAVLAACAAVALVTACTSRVPRRWLSVAAAALACGVWLPLLPTTARMAELHVIDVGQGDAIALRTPAGRWILFDAGRSWRGGDAGRAVVIPYLRRRGGDIAAFVLSHPHEDHVGGAPSVLRALRPAAYVDGAYLGGATSYRTSLEIAQRSAIPWRRARPGDSLVIDAVVIRLLAPDSAWMTGLRDANEASTVALVRYGAVRFLLVGDAEQREEAWLLAHAPDALRAEVLKVGHHGSATSSSHSFVAAVRPALSLISVGAGNPYGHPNAGVLRRLAAAGSQVLRTDHSGSIVVRSDGRRIDVEAGQDSWTLAPR